MNIYHLNDMGGKIMAEKANYFMELYGVDVREKAKEKNGLSYLSWAAAWAEVKKLFPDATYKIYEDVINISEKLDNGTEISRSVLRPWFDDGRTGWVKTGVTINGIEHIEELPIMDFKNQSIKAEAITSAAANKSIQRSLTKACARHGLGLYIYEGEDMPEEVKQVMKLQMECMDLIKKKCALSDKAKEKVAEISKELIRDANGDPREVEDTEVLTQLRLRLAGVRK